MEAVIFQKIRWCENMDELSGILLGIENRISIKSESFLEWIKITIKCITILTRINLLMEYRSNEEREGKKRLRYKKLDELIQNNIKPIELTGDDFAVIFDEIFYLPFPLPEDIYQYLEKYIKYSIVLHDIFIDLNESGMQVPKLTLRMVDILYQIHNKAVTVSHEVGEKEKQRDRNIKNASSNRIVKPEDFKSHDKYPELEDMVKTYQGTPKEIRDINELISDIIKNLSEDKEKAVSRPTIRRYRHLLFDEMKNRK